MTYRLYSLSKNTLDSYNARHIITALQNTENVMFTETVQVLSNK